MKDREKKEIEKALFKEVNNKEKIIENCNNILDAKASLNSNVEKRYKRTQRRFAFISVACIMVIISIALIVLLPPMFKPDGGDDEDETYYTRQEDWKWERIEELDSFMEENNLTFKTFKDQDNYDGFSYVHDNAAIVYYDKDNDAFMGIKQDIDVITEDFIIMGSIHIYPSKYVIEEYENMGFVKTVIDGIEIGYFEFPLAEEYSNEYFFTYQGYKYYVSVNSSRETNAEYFVKHIVG